MAAEGDSALSGVLFLLIRIFALSVCERGVKSGLPDDRNLKNHLSS